MTASLSALAVPFGLADGVLLPRPSTARPVLARPDVAGARAAVRPADVPAPAPTPSAPVGAYVPPAAPAAPSEAALAERALVLAAQAGETQAFAGLVRVHQRRAY